MTEQETVAEAQKENLFREQKADRAVVKTTNFPYEIHPVRPPGIEFIKWWLIITLSL